MSDLLPRSAAQVRSLLDAIPSMVFLIDRELRIIDANLAATRLFGGQPEEMEKRLCGTILRCIHAHDSHEGCGKTPYCEGCTIRHSVLSATCGSGLHRMKHRMRIRENGQEREVVYLVTSTPYEQEGEVLSVICLEDISELYELRGIVPICAKCKKVRDDTLFWSQVESYMNKHMGVHFSHGYCPDCLKDLYPDLE